MTRRMTGYWLRHPNDPAHLKVDRKRYVQAERDQGFINWQGQKTDPATSSFKGPDGIEGTQFKPEQVQELPRRFAHGQFYFDPAGEPIDVMEWAKHLGGSRLIREDEIDVTGDLVYGVLRTLYLGAIHAPHAHSGLYGTAVIVRDLAGQQSAVELQQYSTATEAYLGHLDHHDAILLGHHCHYCRVGKDHPL